jgi:hypothetical protein
LPRWRPDRQQLCVGVFSIAIDEEVSADAPSGYARTNTRDALRTPAIDSGEPARQLSGPFHGPAGAVDHSA